MFEVILIIALIAIDLGGSMVAHKSCVEVTSGPSDVLGRFCYLAL